LELCDFCVRKLLRAGQFAPGTRILLVHTGGLQATQAAKLQ
jgi:1-aminocyclopropane-1-carboxylate deaminase/D-cysteine desulfhydrase-like pyridoxal-dependent ACC family enzyme